MKPPRTTLILLLLALGLGGFVYFYEIQGAPQRQQAEDKEKQIFSFAENDVQSLSIKTESNTIKLERESPKSNDRKWLIKSPISSPAQYAYVSYLMDLLVRGKSEQSLLTNSSQLKDYGLAKPFATIEIQLKDEKSHSLLLGNSNFNNRFIYALENSSTEPESKSSSQVSILLVSPNFKNAVNRDISEWKKENTNPQTTPSPTPLSTASPSQTLPNPSLSPIPTATPNLVIPPSPSVSPSKTDNSN